MASSSPSGLGSERSLDRTREFAPFSSLPSNVPSRFEGIPLDRGLPHVSSGTVSSPAQGEVFADQSAAMNAPNEYAFSHESDPRSWPSELPAIDGVEQIRSAYPRYPAASASPGDFAPCATQDGAGLAQPHHRLPNQYDFAQQQQQQQQQRDSMLYAPQLRSMSYGNVEQVSHSASFGHSFTPDQRVPQPSSHYPSNLDVQHISRMPTVTGPTPFQDYEPQHAYQYQQGFHDLDNSAALRPQQAYGGPWYTGNPGFLSGPEEPDAFSHARSQPG